MAHMDSGAVNTGAWQDLSLVAIFERVPNNTLSIYPCTMI
jgi:hypothetical protein